MNRRTIIWIILAAVILVLICLAVYFLFLKGQTNQGNSQLANPASVFCEEHGGSSEIRTDKIHRYKRTPKAYELLESSGNRKDRSGNASDEFC